jgi:hypothetical protein
VFILGFLLPENLLVTWQVGWLVGQLKVAESVLAQLFNTVRINHMHANISCHSACQANSTSSQLADCVILPADGLLIMETIVEDRETSPRDINIGLLVFAQVNFQRKHTFTSLGVDV